MKKHKTDNTTKDRQARRRSELDRRARVKGYKSWANYETDFLNDRVDIQRKPKP
jgi:hypothetical protein